MYSAILAVFTGARKGRLLPIAVVAFAAILIYLGSSAIFGLFKVRESLTVEKISTAIAVAANTDLQKGILLQDKTATNTSASIDKLETAKKNAARLLDQAEVARIAEIMQIEQDAALDAAAKKESVSRVQISSMWKNYCQFNDDPACAEQLQGATK